MKIVITLSLEWEYINTKMNNIADTLSRLPVDENEEGENKEGGATTQVNRVFIGNNGEEIVPNNVQELANKGQSDNRYNSLIEFIEGEQNWEGVEDNIKSYQQAADEIRVEKFGNAKLLVYEGKRIIPPHDSRRELLIAVHRTHKSKEMTMRTARANFWWPGLTNQVNQLVDRCNIGKDYKRVQRAKLGN